MSAGSAIQWTHHTHNPWWGCYEQSPACDHCYAKRLAARFGVRWGAAEAPRFASQKQLEEPFRLQQRAERRKTRYRVFCASMSDVMDPRAIFDVHRVKLYDTIERTPRLDWMLLTKQPKNFRRLLPQHWLAGGLPKNVWVGITAENQEWLERRVGYLLDIPAQVLFLSMEPLLSAVDLEHVKIRSGSLKGAVLDVLRGTHLGRMFSDRAIGWVIAGGESGPRPMHPDWVRGIRDQCERANVPFFFKQWGSWAPSAHANDLAKSTREGWMLPTGELLPAESPYGIKLVKLRKKKDSADADGFSRLDGAYHLAFPKQARLCV